MGSRHTALAWLAIGFVVLALVLSVGRGLLDDDPDEVERTRSGVADGEARLEGRASDDDAARDAEADASSTVQDGPCAVDLAVHEDHRTPVAGATIRAVLADGSVRTVTTDDLGEARLERVPAGRVDLTATRRGYALSDPVRVGAVPEVDAYVVLRLERAAALHGTVVDHRDGRPVVGASVTALEGGAICMNPYPPQRLGREFGATTTDGHGAFVVEDVALEPLCAVRLVRVEAAGYRTLWKVAPTPGEDDADFVVRLVPGGTVTGRVLDAEGAPVAGATVYADLDGGRGGDPTLTPDFVGLPDRFFFYGSLDGGPSHPEWAESDAYVALRTRTGADGRFRLEGLGLGERYVLGATAPGHAASAPQPDVHAKAKAPLPDVTLRLQPPCTIVVRCTDADDLPFPDLEVSISRKSGYGPDVQKVRTDDAGVARLVDLREDAYHVRIHDYRSGNTIHEYPETKPGEQELVVHSSVKRPTPWKPRTKPTGGPRPPSTPRPATLVGRIVLPAGTAPPAYVGMRGHGAGGAGYSGSRWEPDPDGALPIRWTIEWTTFTFTVEAEGFLPIVREVERSPGELFDLGTVTLDPGQVLVGRVLTSRGEALSGVRVDVTYRCDGARFRAREGLWIDDGEEETLFDHHLVTDANGGFRVAGLPRGYVSLSMEDARFLATTVDVDVPLEDGPLRIVPPTGAWLRLLAVDGDDHPTPRCHVAVERLLGDGGTDTEAWGETDVTGSFRVRIPPARYRLEVSPDEYRREEETQTVVVELMDGETRNVRVLVERP